jgi:hypothetical protein
VVDVITGFKSELAALPPGFIPMTEDMGRAALIAAEGPEQAQQTLAKATAVVNVVRSISPDVADRLDYALGASGAGNIPGIVRQFARLHDLAPDGARRMLERSFGADGAKAADRLFGLTPRRR